MMTLCTLFDHNYLDKGLALYESLENVCDGFMLYVLCMSDKCYEILSDMSLPRLTPVRLSDFEDEELLRVKPTRGVGEYCWTCSSSLILYVLRTFKPEYCTYVDADIFFYSDPSYVIQEMKEKGASAQVIGHRFNDEERLERENQVGKYCVEFNTFKNDSDGLRLLEIWRNQCLDHCSIDGDGVYWGDQKYQDNWVEDYPFVIETSNIGAGVAPWNIDQYSFGRGKDSIELEYKGKPGSLVFYHFENVKYLTRKKVYCSVPKIVHTDILRVRRLYKRYLKTIQKQKDFLRSKYGIDIILFSHPALTGKDSDAVYNGLDRIKNEIIKALNVIRI